MKTEDDIIEEEDADVCEFCGGKDGEHEEMTTMETVWAGEPHQAPIGSQRCPNSIDDDYEPDLD